MNLRSPLTIAVLAILLSNCGIFDRNKMIVKNETELQVSDIRASLGGGEQSRPSLAPGETLAFSDVAEHDDSMFLTYRLNGRVQSSRFSYVTKDMSVECRVYIEVGGPDIHC